MEMLRFSAREGRGGFEKSFCAYGVGKKFPHSAYKKIQEATHKRDIAMR